MAILNLKLPTNLTEYPNSFKRQGAFPLEAYSVFYAIHDESGAVTTTALQAAKDYAQNNPISYVGQIFDSPSECLGLVVMLLFIDFHDDFLIASYH